MYIHVYTHTYTYVSCLRAQSLAPVWVGEPERAASASLRQAAPQVRFPCGERSGKEKP